jgi:D-xylose transport system substrate-binding protein
MRVRPLITTTLALALGLAGLSACASGDDNSDGGSDGAVTIGLLLPEAKVPRYESKDRPYFEAKLKELCADCKVLYANANSDASKQQQQAESMIAQGVKALVVDPFDSVAAESIAEAAAAQDIPVVSYDRIIQSDKVSYAVTNNYEEAGAVQAQALLDKLAADGVTPEDGGIVMLNGADTDTSGLRIAKGAHSVIDDSGFEVLAEEHTWDPPTAQDFTASQITQFGDEIVAIYSANDGNGLAAVAALKAASAPIVPITGQDASLAALQAVLAGDMFETIYNSFKLEAETAADVAYKLAKGEEPSSDDDLDGIPTTFVQPVSVTVDNMNDTIIKDEFFTTEELCTPEYEDACAAAGIS